MEKPLLGKSVFISYAHKDDTENFVSRLGYSLDMYVDAFWDAKLQIGSWDKQLIIRIQSCEIFLVVMSLYQKEASEWCKRELDAALIARKAIIPIKRFENHFDDRLEKLQYADFMTDFDKGFKELTFLMTGQKLTSWEYLEKQSDEELFLALQQGILPALISKEFAEWLIVSHLWPAFKLSITKLSSISMLEPRTLVDIYRALDNLGEQLAGDAVRDFSARSSSNRAQEFVVKYLNMATQISDNDHQAAGRYATKVLNDTMQYLETNILMKRDFQGIARLRHSYLFDTASKLRELVLLHSRRSRHLY